MLTALRYFRAAISEFYFDLPRMVFLNLLWFLTALPFIFIAFTAFTVVRGVPGRQWTIFAVQAAVPLVASLALAGPGTAAIYHVINRAANGELLEVRRFWPAFRQFFWRGWLLGAADVGTGLLLILNVWFYGTAEQPGLRLLSLVFGYLLILWFAIQSYLFPLLVEMNQSILLVIRNSLFLAIDNLGITLGLVVVNLIVLAVSVFTGAGLLPFATMALLSLVGNKAVVDAVERYRASGRIIRGDSRTED